MKKRLIILYCFLILPIDAWSLTVIADYGGTSLAGYFERFKTSNDSDLAPAPKPIPDIHLKLKARFPVRTPELTVGRVKKRPLPHHMPIHLPNHFALIGVDKVSLKWLKRHRKKLEQYAVTVFVVNVDTPEQLRLVRQFLPNNLMDAFSASTLAKKFNLKHYPVMISSRGVEQ